MKWPLHIIQDPVPYDPAAHLKRIKKLYADYHFNTFEKRSRYIDLLTSDIPEQYRPAFTSFLISLLVREGDFFEPDEKPAEANDFTKERYDKQEELLTNAQARAEEITKALINFLSQFDNLPPGESGMMVSLYEIIPELPRVVHQLAGAYTCFPDFSERFMRNACNISGLDYDTLDERSGKKLVFPMDSGLPHDQLVARYIDGTALIELLTIPIPFRIPTSVRCEHFLMVARTGSGKTQYIQRDILDNLLAHDSPGMVVIDSQNQMIPKLEQLQVARDRIIIIDPFDPSPPALNMFLSPGPVIDDPHLRESIEANTLQQFAWIFSALDQELTGRQTTLFTFTARVLLSMGANMQTLLELMRIEKPTELKRSPFWPHIESSDEQTRYFFENRFCTNDYNRTKGGVADRLLGVLRIPAFNRMFMAPANRLDLHRALAERKLVVFNTHKSRLGNDASAILGRYAISLYVRAAFERELEKTPPAAMLYVDEASEYFGKKDSSDVLFTQLRKYNAGTFVAFQDLSQLGEQLHTLVANTTTKITGGLSIADARRLAPDMRTTDDDLMSIRKMPGAFDFMCFINNQTPRAVRLTFEYGAVEHAPQLTKEEHLQLRQRNREALSAPPLPRPTPAARPPTASPEPARQEAAPQGARTGAW